MVGGSSLELRSQYEYTYLVAEMYSCATFCMDCFFLFFLFILFILKYLVTINGFQQIPAV